ncbi:PLP-dependent cysteine synthase family protein [uncultured Amnibacterium sp.]|uniref:PLP-dependent cysteine synthase family protein n=1 Tax=uncultured Amnibacterium sp. TaxID=1631851 RepID=UPI0035C9AA34
MTRYESVAEAVGHTPMIRLTKHGLRPRISVKPEWLNPAGSVKDRAALSMIRAAAADGSLPPGGIVVETTSGNTGIGLAAFAAHLGYRSVVFTSSAISQEKRDLLIAHGAELRLVDVFVPKSHPDSLASVAQRFVDATPGAWLAGQYDNPANPGAHVVSTGPEIWADTDGAVTHFVATVGTGGTISGTGRFLKDVSGGRVQIVAADPATSSYSGGDGSAKYVEGAGHAVHPEAEEDVWPKSLDTSVIDRYEQVDDRGAIDAIHDLAASEGLLAGGSAGVALAAGFRVAAELGEDDDVVILLPDSGRAYLSTYFNPVWLRAHGFRDAEGAVARQVAVVARTVDPRWSVPEALEGASDNEPLLVAYVRSAVPPHPSEVLGTTTVSALRGAASVRDATTPAPWIGAGQSPEEALEAADRARPGWTTGILVDDGRVTALVERAALTAPAPPTTAA